MTRPLVLGAQAGAEVLGPLLGVVVNGQGPIESVGQALFYDSKNYWPLAVGICAVAAGRIQSVPIEQCIEVLQRAPALLAQQIAARLSGKDHPATATTWGLKLCSSELTLLAEMAKSK